MSDTAIQVENVTKTFGKATVLDNITLSFQKGQITGLIGRNGSGKTMLLKCIRLCACHSRENHYRRENYWKGY